MMWTYYHSIYFTRTDIKDLIERNHEGSDKRAFIAKLAIAEIFCQEKLFLKSECALAT